MPVRSRSVAPVIAVVLMIAVTVVLTTVVSVFVLAVGEGVSETAPNAELEIEFNHLGDGVQKNDSVRIIHITGDQLERERLEIVIGDDVVYNETADSETTNSNFAVPGLVVEVDGDEFNDLNKPCRVNGKLVSPPETCGGPPGDSNGSDSSVVLEWTDTVSAGQTVVIQERNAPEAVDVIEPGETVRVIYRGDGFSAVLATETVPQK